MTVARDGVPTRTSSPLEAVHTEHGAVFIDFAGWRMPVRYGSELAEHRAVREAAGIFDLSHMGEIEVSGPEAARMLDFALVGRLSAVPVGRARYTMLCHDNGGVLDDLVVYRLAEQRFLVVANAANADIVYILLRDRAHGFAAEVANRSTDYALIAVQGPRSATIVGTVADADPSPLKYYASMPTRVAGIDVLLARTGYTGEDGFEVYCAPERAADIWRALTVAGAAHGLLPAGLACRDTLRLEAGMPLYGNELHVGVTPFDVGLGRVVKFDKPGTFVGRTALAAREQAGGGRTLLGLIGSSRRAGRHGYEIYADDRAVGVVTSGALSPTLGVPIAMAMVDSDHAAPGTALTIDVRGRREPVETTALPFYSRS
ncbi:glycine cleavage system aminomethyltransferase GcvT [Nocardia otitidiscaviarum]|uniref:glycine cleavage system aminomethyltransferase GcvT n=1 Tax=Nocardia otitidiscaviarum TaxID=1823 RepID=UPI000694EE29|nr:glycine cleavage system aminomethyltransferase GcvT [Nocardia otitidiscaviarum]MBF6135695.1 glycine cleavage system aminomethyltransferase GcvT [Nocardia otitidiscaviarum]MBF6487513.1 glycine cleavage system aminomethyltransferase GcvT [Nocardia otitidiscaviarum]